MLQTPVLLIIFNRPDKTAVVFERIRQQQPKRLYIAADGPRANKAGEKEKCAAARNLVLKGVDWDCEVKTLFREENLGCGLGPSQGINWFFETEEEGIILEDDCVPNDSFFIFCTTLLNKYKPVDKVMMISGCSFQDKAFDDNSYYFSRYAHIWGWATWQRAWQHYDFKIGSFNAEETESFLKRIFKKKSEREIWLRNFLLATTKTQSIWDYQWMYAMWKNEGLSIVPWKNMVSNIGYGDDATHTTGYDTKTINLPAHAISKIKHPSTVKANQKADDYIRYKVIMNKPSALSFLKKMARKVIKKGNA